MAKLKPMSDDEVMDYTYNKLFGDLDDIEHAARFGTGEKDIHDVAPNAGTPGIAGIELTIRPSMAAVAESGRAPQNGPEKEEEEEEEIGE